MKCFLVRFYSTNEQWHMAVCETLEVAKIVAAGYGITEPMTKCDGWESLKNPRDESQTVVIDEFNIVTERK